jgi:hypothetical protein
MKSFIEGSTSQELPSFEKAAELEKVRVQGDLGKQINQTISFSMQL